MKWLNKFRSPLLWGLLLLMVALLGFPLSHAQAAGSITPPSATAKPATAGPNMLTPDGSIGSQGHYRNYLNWQSATATQSAATQYAVLTPGQSVNAYVSFYKGGLAENNFRTALAIGGSGASLSSEDGGTTQAGGNQANVTALSGGSKDENNIGYKLTAPNVTKPTWVYFQVQYRGKIIAFGDWVGSTIFPMLVLPANFGLTATVDPIFTFGTSMAMTATTNSTLPAGVTLDFSGSNSLPGKWTNSGTFTATNAAAGTAVGSFTFPRTVPYPNVAGVTGTNYATTTTGYFGSLANQTVYDGGNAEFKLELPAGLIASDVKWYVGDKLQSGSGTTLDLNRVSKKEYGDTKAIKAEMTVSKNGDGAFSLTTTANAMLTIKDSPLKLSASQPLVFSGPKQPVPSDTTVTPGETSLSLKLASTPYAITPDMSKVSWSVSDPDLGRVVKSNNNGAAKFMAADNATGAVTITASYTDNNQTFYSSVEVQIAHLNSPATVKPGGTAQLFAPGPLKDQNGLPQHTYSYMWIKYRSDDGNGFFPFADETNQELKLTDLQPSDTPDPTSKSAGQWGVVVTVDGKQVIYSNIASVDVSKFLASSMTDVIFSAPTYDPSTDPTNDPPTTQVPLVGKYNNNNQPGVSWSGDDPSLGTISSTGLLTANDTGKTGVVTVTGKYLNETDSKQIVVGHIKSPSGQQLVGSTVSFTAPSSASGATWTYQWQKLMPGQSRWTPIPGATSASYTTPGLLAADDGAQYRVSILTNGYTANSNAVTVHVLPDRLKFVKAPDFVFGSDTQPTVADLMNGTYNGSTTDVTAPDYNKVWLMPKAASYPMILADGRQPAGQSYTVSLAADQFKNADGTPISSQAGTAKLLLNMTWSGQPAVQQTVADDGQPVALFGSIPVSTTTHELTTQITPALAINSSNQAKAGNYSSQLTWTLTTGP